MEIKTGISLYLSTDIQKNIEVINKASISGVKFAFTSLNILEENNIDKSERLYKLIELCSSNDIKLIVDINEYTNSSIFSNLKNVYLRIDDGYSLDEIYELSKKNMIVLNASTITKNDLKYLNNKGIDFNKLLALHNYYPKKYTGIGEKYFLEQNEKYNEFGIRTMAFVSGDLKRGPMFEGLPTLENTREERFIISVLKLISLKTDIVLVGDIDLSDENWKYFKYISDGIVPLKNIDNILNNIVFENRRDYSEYLIRSKIPESIGKTRKEFKEYIQKELRYIKKENREIRKGDILLSNEKYLRYEGEVEIALKNLGIDEKRDVVSRVCEEDVELLYYISIINKFIFWK